MDIEYKTSPAGSGIVYRHRAHDVATITDEPYPPGGFLRVMRDSAGRLIAGPLVSEIVEWPAVKVQP